jgi:hypothetical protein
MGQNLGRKKSYLVVEIATTIENRKKNSKFKKKICQIFASQKNGQKQQKKSYLVVEIATPIENLFFFQNFSVR